MASTPPHQQEQTNSASSSSGQHIPSAVPPIPSTSTLPPRQPVTFNGQTYYNLPPNLAALLNAHSSIPTPAPAPAQHRGHRPAASVIAPSSVSFSFPFLCLFTNYNL